MDDDVALASWASSTYYSRRLLLQVPVPGRGKGPGESTVPGIDLGLF